MTDSHIKCMVCICVSFLYSCLTFETLHYPWIPSFYMPNEFHHELISLGFLYLFMSDPLETCGL